MYIRRVSKAWCKHGTPKFSGGAVFIPCWERKCEHWEAGCKSAHCSFLNFRWICCLGLEISLALTHAPVHIVPNTGLACFAIQYKHLNVPFYLYRYRSVFLFPSKKLSKDYSYICVYVHGCAYMCICIIPNYFQGTCHSMGAVTAINLL